MNRTDLLVRLRSFRRDEQGNILLLTAGCAAALIASLAFAVDLGSHFYEKRKMQAAVDLAAIGGAELPTSAQAIATDIVRRNGYATPESLQVEVGAYTGRTDLPPASRFVPGASPANAVRVTMAYQSPAFFGRSVSGQSSVRLRTSAVAAKSEMTQFSIGSRLVGVNGGIANEMLSRIFGSNVSLSVMDYNALAGAKVDLFEFSKALATQLNLQTATFNELANAHMTAGDIYTALSILQRSGGIAEPGTGPGLDALSINSGAAALDVVLGKLIGYGPYGPQPVSDAPAAGTSVGLMDLVMASAMVANGTRQIQLSLGATIPGIASTTVKLAAGERLVTSPWLTMDDRGTTVRTVQTRAYFDLRVGASGALAGVQLAVPVFVELAASHARLDSLACSNEGTSRNRVTLAVSPGFFDLWMGEIDPRTMTGSGSTPTVRPATLVSVPLISVTGSAHIQGHAATEHMVNFNQTEITALTVKSASSSGIAGSLVGSLVDGISLAVQVGPLHLPSPAVTAAANTALDQLQTPLDGLVESLLSLAGVRLGQADVIVNGLRCDGAVLVQ